MEPNYVVIGLLAFFGWWVIIGLLYWYLFKKILKDFENAPLEIRRELLKTRRQRHFRK